MKSMVQQSAISDIRGALAQLPPPLPTNRRMRIDEATSELYDDIRGAILQGHSLSSLAESVFAPGGWAVSSERIRRAILALARQRHDRELADKIGGLKRRKRQPSKTSLATKPTKHPRRTDVGPSSTPPTHASDRTMPLPLE